MNAIQHKKLGLAVWHFLALFRVYLACHLYNFEPVITYAAKNACQCDVFVNKMSP